MGSLFDATLAKAVLVAAGIEVFHAHPKEVRIAERVRLHLMDAGIWISFGPQPRLLFTARAQRSDFPHEPEDRLFDRVRKTVGLVATARGYSEFGAQRLEVKDPVDPTRVLDVWHEITYTKVLADLPTLLDEVRWALRVEKYVAG